MHQAPAKVAMIGLGKLGLPVAEAMSARFEVTGYDIAERTSEKISIARTLPEALNLAELVFVAVETPHDPQYEGRTFCTQLSPRDFDYSVVTKCFCKLARHLEPDQTVVLISTVLPGTLRRELASLLPGRELIYNPYLISMGAVVSDFLNPEMVIVGTKTAEETPGLKKLKILYDQLLSPGYRWVAGTWEEAESVKIFYNTFISAKLAIVNMIQDVSERTGHMNVDVVTKALAESTQRIMSPAYMTAGMGDGGPCHPRDNIALRHLSRRLELGYDLFSAIAESREKQAQNLARFLLQRGKDVCIVGVTYKPNVAMPDGSYSFLVGHAVSEQGGTLSYYDPVIDVGDSAYDLKNTKPKVFLISFWQDWVKTFPFPEGSIVVDPWRRIPLDQFGPSIRVIHYGNTRP